MHPVLRNILSVLAGIVFGSLVNMGIIMVSGKIIPPPEGADVTTIEGLKASIHLFQPIHFMMPFLAHAIGTLAGAFLAAKIAFNHKMKFAIGIGFYFLIGGISSVFMFPSPVWFICLDLILAYLPMAYLGGKIENRIK